MPYQKTANIVGILVTSLSITFFRLITGFCRGHNVRRFARGYCIYLHSLIFINNIYRYIAVIFHDYKAGVVVRIVTIQADY